MIPMGGQGNRPMEEGREFRDRPCLEGSLTCNKHSTTDQQESFQRLLDGFGKLADYIYQNKTGSLLYLENKSGLQIN